MHINVNSFINCPTRYVFISGSYDCSRNNDILCKQLGLELAKYNIGIVSAGSKPGVIVVNSMYKTLCSLHAYTPGRLLTYYRIKPRDINDHPNVGCIVYTGASVSEVRQAAFLTSCALIIIGGAARTKEEALLAKRLNFPIIPIGMSGGTANILWNEQSGNIPNQAVHLNLNHKNPKTAVAAVITLLKFHFVIRESQISCNSLREDIK